MDLPKVLNVRLDFLQHLCTNDKPDENDVVDAENVAEGLILKV